MIDVGTGLFAGTTLMGLLLAGWARVKGWITQLTGLLIVRARFQSGFAEESMLAYLMAEFTPSRGVPYNFVGVSRYVISRKRQHVLFYNTIRGGNSTSSTWWKGWRWLTVHHSNDQNGRRLDVSFIRGMWDMTKLVSACDHFYNVGCKLTVETERHSLRFLVNRMTGTRGEMRVTQGGPDRSSGGALAGSPPESTNPDLNLFNLLDPVGYSRTDITDSGSSSCDPYHGLVLTKEMRAVREEARRWAKSSDWFAERGIPWRRGWLFQGSPGTGKSAFLRCLSVDLDKPLLVMDLASMTNRDFAFHWERVQAYSPCVVAIEDIDAVFEGRKNVTGDDGVTFDCLLNCISGISQNNGVMLVITSNHADKLDPALLRPGRVDRKCHFGELNTEEQWELARLILKEDAHLAPIKHLPMTAAELTEKLVLIALERFWGAPSSYTPPTLRLPYDHQPVVASTAS